MTKEEIIEMAQRCGLFGIRPYPDGTYFEALEVFAKLVAEKSKQEQGEPVAMEWVGLTEEELIVIKGKTCPEIDWSARHGVPLNNGEQNAWLFSWFMAFAKEIEAKLKEKNET